MNSARVKVLEKLIEDLHLMDDSVTGEKPDADCGEGEMLDPGHKKGIEIVSIKALGKKPPLEDEEDDDDSESEDDGMGLSDLLSSGISSIPVTRKKRREEE